MGNLHSDTMPGSQHEEASWDDLDWSILEPVREDAAPAPAVSTASFTGSVESAPLPRLPDSGAQLGLGEQLVRETAGSVAPTEGATPAVPVTTQPFPVDLPVHSLPDGNGERSSSAPPSDTHHAPVVFSPSGSARITLCTEDGEDVVVVVKDRISVGRGSQNNLVIKDLYVSSRHAQITSKGGGLFEIEDLHSTGGTFVNEKLVQRQVLKNGDCLRFATVEAVFHYTAGSQLENCEDTVSTLPPPSSFPESVIFDSNHPGRPALVLPDGSRFFLPAEGRVRVGRLETNDVVLTDGRVSGHHARILCTGTKQFEIIDLNSTWGTFVNKVRIANRDLADGDTITIGVVDCVLKL